MKMGTSGSAGSGNNRKNLTIVLFGKTGNGKSSVGNTILSTGNSQERFLVGSGLASTSVEIKTITTLREGVTIKVIDIPDFTNLDCMKDQVKEGIKSLKTQNSSTPDAILLAIRCDVRYTKEEYDIYTQFKEIWGGHFRDHLIVVFTFGDRQDHDIKKDLKKANPELKRVLKDAKKRYVVFGDKDDKDGVVKNLMEEIKKIQRGEIKFCSVL